MHRPSPRALPRLAAAIAIGLAMLFPAALPAAAREPHRPLPDYRPSFVTERERGAWNDCLWASASMLIDKWTAGRLTISKDRLRSLSGDAHAGSSFLDLAPVLRGLGFDARWSPEGGDFVTWTELRARVRAGGGAVLLGDYSELPRWYARWDLAFWKNKGKKDNHAIYLDRYDGRTDRFWVMDPLAPAGWDGEWIPAAFLRAYAWQTGGGGLWVLMTPTAKRAPFAGVKLSRATAAVDAGDLVMTWDIRKKPKGWKLPRVKLIERVERVDDPAALGAVDALSIVNGADARSKKASVRLVHKQIEARLAAPREPGAYEVTIAVRDRRFGRTATKGSTLVYVPGERRGAILVSDPVPALAGSSLALDVVVVNTGTADWSDAAARAAPFAELMEPRATTVRAIWTPLGDGGPAAPDPIDLLAVPLAPGEGTSATLAVPTPATPGDWVLTLDIVDRLDGSFAAGGSAPRTVRTTIVDERDPTGPRRDP